MVATMKTKSTRTVTSAKKISCIPKKMIDQSRLRRIWTEKRKSPCFTAGSCIPFLMTRYSAIPIRIERIVHAGPNNQFGGLKAGFVSAAYHPGIAGMVKTEPIMPTTSGMARQRMKRMPERKDLGSILIKTEEWVLI